MSRDPVNSDADAMMFISDFDVGFADAIDNVGAGSGFSSMVDGDG